MRFKLLVEMLRKVILFISIIFLALFQSCFNNSDRDYDVEVQSSLDYLLIQKIFHHVGKQVHEFARNDTSLNELNVGLLSIEPCLEYYNVYLTDNDFPMFLELEFGDTSKSECLDGSMRTGRIKAEFSGNYADSTKKVDVTFRKFYYNQYKITGDILIKNRGRVRNGNYVYRYTFTDCVIKDTINDVSMSFNGELEWEWVTGRDRIQAYDDAFDVTGTITGTGSKGTNYTAKITSALRVDYTCAYPLKGIIELKPGNLLTRTLDFGIGECTNNVLFTSNYLTTTIQLK